MEFVFCLTWVTGILIRSAQSEHSFLNYVILIEHSFNSWTWD